MRVLVTGVAGFIGSNLAGRLVVDGHDVVGLDDLSDGTRENLERARGIRFEEADLRDARSVASAAAGCEVIFHQGAKRSVPRSIDEPELFTDVNVRGTLNVLLAARAEGARVVSASSSSVYGDQDRFPLDEGMYPRPRSPYAASKLAGEGYCLAFWSSLGVRAVSLRYFNVYGPGQDPASEYAAVVPRFVLACLTGRAPVIHGDGEQARDFTYIDDVVEGTLRVLDRPAPYALYNIGNHTPVALLDYIAALERALGRKAKLELKPMQPGDVKATYADTEALHRAVGFAPATPLETGLARFAEWFMSYYRERR